MNKKNTNQIIKIMTMPKDKTTEWAKKCLESNGLMIMVPKDMADNANEMVGRADDFLKAAKEFDKLSAEFDNYAKNFWFEMRKSLEKLGYSDIYSKNIGWNEQAKKEGVNVINVTNPTQGGMRM
jgi:hypothetical protein